MYYDKAIILWKLRAFKELTFQVISNTKVLSVMEGPEAICCLPPVRSEMTVILIAKHGISHALSSAFALLSPSRQMRIDLINSYDLSTSLHNPWDFLVTCNYFSPLSS